MKFTKRIVVTEGTLMASVTTSEPTELDTEVFRALGKVEVSVGGNGLTGTAPGIDPNGATYSVTFDATGTGLRFLPNVSLFASFGTVITNENVAKARVWCAHVQADVAAKLGISRSAVTNILDEDVTL